MTHFTKLGNDLKQSTIKSLNSTKITKTKGGNNFNNVAFSSEILNPKKKEIFSWDITIHKMTNDIAVGLVSNLHNQDPNKDFDDEHAYWNNLWNGWVSVLGQDAGYAGCACKPGDIYTFIVNFKTMKLEYTKNNKKINKKNDIKPLVMITNSINKKYRFALSIRNVNDSISVKYNNYKNPIEEKKQNIDNKPRRKSKHGLKRRHHTTQLQCDVITGAITGGRRRDKKRHDKTRSVSMGRNKGNGHFRATRSLSPMEFKKMKTKQSDEYDDKIRAMIAGLQQDSMEKSKKIAELKRRIFEMENDANHGILMKDKVTTLTIERKEFKIIVTELKEENKKLKILSGNYEVWNADEIVYWIISLNPEIYSQYEQILLKSLKEEHVNGECIDDIEVDDIKRWGIVNFKHSKTLMEGIKLLVQKRKENKPIFASNQHLTVNGNDAMTKEN